MDGHGPGTRFAGRVGRHAAAYGAASGATMVAGLVSVVVFTRYLDPSEFGKMAVLTTVATITMLVANLTILPGTMRRVYGTTGDEDVGEVDQEERAAAMSRDPRLALTTGLVLTVVFGAIVFLAVWFLRGQLAGLFGGTADEALIVLAAGAGAAGALMRFCQYILRLQLRSVAYLMVSLVCAFGSIALAIPLLVEGLGIEAVLLGLIVGNVAAAALAMGMLALDLRPAVSLGEATAILRGGISFLPIIVSFQTVQVADTLLVASFGSFSQTGLYRVAQRIAMPVSFGTSVFQQSWGPMRHDLTQAAVDRLDEERTYTARLFTYYAVFVTGLILIVAVLADQLVQLASSEFAEAATLVPLTTVSVAGHGWFIFAYRTAKMGMRWLIGLSIVVAMVFVAGSALAIPALGAVGAPLAAIAGWGLATAIMLVVNQVRGTPIPFEYGHLATLAALTFATWGFAHLLLPDTPLGTVATLAALLAWAGALLAFRIVPLREVQALARFARDAGSTESKRQLRGRIAALDGLDGVLVDEVVRRRRSPQAVADRIGASEEEVIACTVQALRTAAGGGEPRETDLALGELILVRRPRADRDSGLLAISFADADPIDADLIKRAAAVAGSRRGPRPRRLNGRRAE